MKKYLIALCLLSVLSCQRNAKPVSQNNLSERKNSKLENPSAQLFKSVGSSDIKNYNFPKVWSVNTYDTESSQLKKADTDAQKKLEEIDYFKKITGIKIEISDIHYSSFIKNDSLLNLAKIDSLFLIDSRKLKDGKEVKMIKTISSSDNGQYDAPIPTYKIDLVLFDHEEVIKSVNVYSEIDFPYSTRQNICYIDEHGQSFCRQFIIEEVKVTSKPPYGIDLKKLFNIK